MKDFKKENEKKKSYLSGYQNITKKITRMQSELNEIETMMNGIRAVRTEGLPCGNTRSDISDLFAKLDEIQRNLETEQENQIKRYIDIRSSIDQLIDEEEKNILFYRYIKKMSWWNIADQTGFSERQVYRIHGKALSHLKII